MKINVVKNGKKVLVDTSTITFQCGEDRYKSLKASNGFYPEYATLEVGDDIVTIAEEAPSEYCNWEITELREGYLDIVKRQNKSIENEAGDDILIENYFGFDAGTEVYLAYKKLSVNCS